MGPWLEFRGGADFAGHFAVTPVAGGEGPMGERQGDVQFYP